MIIQAPILITGIPRSGASIVAAIVNYCGAFGGVMAKPNQSPNRGMFENVRIKETVVKKYLTDIGVDASGQYPLPHTKYLTIPTDWKNRVEECIVEEGYKGGAWMYKDSRSSLLWPIWHFAYPDAKWVIVRRRTADIVQSCIKTGFMKKFKEQKYQMAVEAKNEAEGWLWMIHQYENKFVEMITEGLNCKVIWPERMARGDYRQLYELCEWVGVPWNVEALGLINPMFLKVIAKRKEG